MPELPEVETVCRALRRHLVGRRIERVLVRDRRLREPVRTRRLSRLAIGHTIVEVRRRAKYIMMDLEADRVVMIHFGMTGRLSRVSAETPFAAHDHVVFVLDDDTELRFNDARRFGLVTAYPRAEEAHHPRLAHLGVEPLGPTFTPAAMCTLAKGSRQPIKNFVMDAKHVAGVGNIYACEALFAAGIRPTRPAGRLSEAAWQRLVRSIRRTLRHAIARGGTTLRDFANLEGEIGDFVVDLCVYGREGQICATCGARIRRTVQARRSTFYCPRCQS